MTSEPLNGKIVMRMGEIPQYRTLYTKESIQSAVKYLKKELFDVLTFVDEDKKIQIHGFHKRITRKIDEAFADVLKDE